MFGWDPLEGTAEFRAEARGYRLGLWQDITSAFSTRDVPGWVQTEGGWALYILDKAGVTLFGAAWPAFMGLSCLLLIIDNKSIINYSFNVMKN